MAILKAYWCCLVFIKNSPGYLTTTRLSKPQCINLTCYVDHSEPGTLLLLLFVFAINPQQVPKFILNTLKTERIHSSVHHMKRAFDCEICLWFHTASHMIKYLCCALLHFNCFMSKSMEASCWIERHCISCSMCYKCATGFRRLALITSWTRANFDYQLNQTQSRVELECKSISSS